MTERFVEVWEKDQFQKRLFEEKGKEKTT